MTKQFQMTAREAAIGTQPEITVADLVAEIEANDIVTVSACPALLMMEFTPPFSRIVPYCVVYGEFTGTDFSFRAEAGPGWSVSADSLTAYEIAAKNRVQANFRARTAAGVYGEALAGHVKHLMEVRI